MSFNLDDYVDVAARRTQFFELYPEGCLVSDWDNLTIGDQNIIIVKAYAYRSPTDPQPGVGHASEPFPGKTPYTKDSELMNAETSAWGRAILAVCPIDSKKIASREEVVNRQPLNISYDDFVAAVKANGFVEEVKAQNPPTETPWAALTDKQREDWMSLATTGEVAW